ncbi:hypothetical protein SpiGrapes_1961 [Sphaerochaeta pleomorpha str. Grapes]|uniref:Uncharacterized protein n=1 Tax=Sphaerochaeta pleomorpha (strain ATCC BAA-1885 / DSM 22778 / Grapes) TaxID=158190 RepID=G8QQA3_SPHPG|nr:hypothetical protein [Sphaerochaeta pleomorpha]AEV29748.1 hypothetical protein SpiGrapes_1961 [Sphaerochaeta pleomorpha str. Grapes]
MQKEILELLLQSNEPWVVYRTLLDLVGLPDSDPQVLQAKRKLLCHPLILGLIDEVNAWPGTVLSSHKSAGQLYHKLSFLADLGIVKDDADFTGLAERFQMGKSKEGLFQLPMQISQQHGGTGENLFAWALCDAPLLLSIADRMGFGPVDDGLAFLISLQRQNGWPCAVSKELGSFRGPGKKADPCPYATLLMLKLLAFSHPNEYTQSCHLGTECLLGLYQESRILHPYMFFMGTDFRKLKAPFIWYDILHVLDVLSFFPWVHHDQRFLDMLELVTSKADAKGFFTPESIWVAWKEWDFGQKKVPSPWLTFLVYRIIKRVSFH